MTNFFDDIFDACKEKILEQNPDLILKEYMTPEEIEEEKIGDLLRSMRKHTQDSEYYKNKKLPDEMPKATYDLKSSDGTTNRISIAGSPDMFRKRW